MIQDMHKAGKWLIRIAVTGILFLLLAGGASAATERKLTAACPSVNGVTVNARWKRGEMTLYLPGCWDLTKITLEMEGAETLQLAEEMAPGAPGETVDLTGLVGQKIIVRNEKQQGRGYLTILQG